MPDLPVSEAQLERLEEISAELEAVYVGDYGTVRPTDALEYLLDTYTPPDASDADAGDETVDTAETIEALTAIDGVGEVTATSLVSAGFSSVEAVRDADPETLAEIDGIGREQAVDIAAAAAAVDEADGPGETESGADADSEGVEANTPEKTPEDTLQQAMSLLDAHDDRWRESEGEEPYEVDLPDGSTTGVRTKDDIKRLVFKHWR